MSPARCFRVRPTVRSSIEAAGTPVGQQVDQLSHLAFAAGSVGVAVGADRHLIDAPGCLHLQVRVVGEKRRDSLLLLVCEQVGTGSQHAAGRKPWVPGAAPVANVGC